jgi:hypothetical protein
MSRKQKNSVRSLTTIVGEIRGTFRNDIANIIKRGQLLQEAKDQLGHGEWLPWLQDKFEMDERTAQRAMSAAKFAAKYDSVSDLHLKKSALYELSSGDDEYPPKVVKAVLKEAKSKVVDVTRILEINDELNPPPPEPIEDAPETDELQMPFRAEAETEAEAEEILDGPPPDLPPPIEPAPLVPFVLSQLPLVCRSTWSRYRPSSGRLRCENTSSASGDFSASSFTGIFIWREAIRFSFVGDGPYLWVSGISH